MKTLKLKQNLKRKGVKNNMDEKNKFYTCKDICTIYGIKDTKARKHMKRIEELFDIDRTRLPRRGVIPVQFVHKYFDQSKKI